MLEGGLPKMKTATAKAKEPQSRADSTMTNEK
jgi:hypothetical protein